MSDDDSGRRILSRKEWARQQRRVAYQKAKARQKTDPRYLALKEAAKEQRRAAYQQAKERRKAEATAEKEKLAAARTERRENERASADEELWKRVSWISRGSSASN